MNANQRLYYSLPRRESTVAKLVGTFGSCCPICGSYEGDPQDCPECGWDASKQKIADYGIRMDLTDEEIMSMRSKPQILIDDDDEYQDQLELMWAKEEIRNC